MRDLKADLELCNKATPGPWYAGVTDDERFMNLHYVTTEPRSYRHDGERAFVEGLIRRDKVVAITLLQTPRFVDCWQFGENTRFIAEAREGWPHAIERALKAEKQLEELPAWEKPKEKCYLSAMRRIAELESLVRELVDALDFMLGDKSTRTDWLVEMGKTYSKAKEVLGDA